MKHPRKFYLGIDLGGINIGIGIVDDEGKLCKFTSVLTEIDPGPEHVVQQIGEAAVNLMDGFEGGVSLAGMGAPGPLDTSTGLVLEMPNFGWENVELGRMMEDELGIKTFIDNDANAAAFGEWWVGAGIGARTLVCFTLGTGVGGGIVLNGDVFRGASDAAAEFGHIIVQPNGRKCGCGKTGCLEAYASATAIAARARALAETGESAPLLELAGGDVSRITSELVSKAARGGDWLSCGIMEEAGRYLAIGISNVMNTLNPDVIVIGGGVAAAGDLIFVPLKKLVRELTFDILNRSVRIVPAKLGIEAGTVGAAGIARKRGELSC